MANIFLCSYFAAVAEQINAQVKFNGKKVAFVDTAAKFEEINFYVSEAREAFERFGAQVLDLDVSAGSGYENLALVSECDENLADKSAEISRILATCDVVYISGGNTFYLLDELRKSGSAEQIVKALHLGKIYIGESAGAIIAAPDTEYATLMDEPPSRMSDFAGLNLVPFCVVPHFAEEPFVEAAREIVAKFAGTHDLRTINNSEFIAV